MGLVHGKAEIPIGLVQAAGGDRETLRALVSAWIADQLAEINKEVTRDLIRRMGGDRP